MINWHSEDLITAIGLNNCNNTLLVRRNLGNNLLMFKKASYL